MTDLEHGSDVKELITGISGNSGKISPQLAKTLPTIDLVIRVVGFDIGRGLVGDYGTAPR